MKKVAGVKKRDRFSVFSPFAPFLPSVATVASKAAGTDSTAATYGTNRVPPEKTSGNVGTGNSDQVLPAQSLPRKSRSFAGKREPGMRKKMQTSGNNSNSFKAKTLATATGRQPSISLGF